MIGLQEAHAERTVRRNRGRSLDCEAEYLAPVELADPREILATACQIACQTNVSELDSRTMVYRMEGTVEYFRRVGLRLVLVDVLMVAAV